MPSMDLSLPAKAPSVARYHGQWTDLLPFAIYDLVGFDDAALEALISVCNSEYGEHGNSVKESPRSSFKGAPLREVFEYHMELGAKGQFEPVYFLVVTELGWKTKGVLVVALDDENMQCSIDKCFLKAEKTCISIVNMQIDMLDWSDVKSIALHDSQG